MLVLLSGFLPVGPAGAGPNTWTSLGPAGPGGDPAIWAMAITAAAVYVGTERGVFKSTDRGATWTSTSRGPSADGVTAIVTDPHAPDTLYAITDRGSIFKSTDGAASWMPAMTGANEPSFYPNFPTLAIDPLTPAILYAGTSSGLFKSTNRGGSWARLTPAGDFPDPVPVVSLAVDPLTPTTVYAGLGNRPPGVTNGLLKSLDGGTTWSPSSQGLPNESQAVRRIAVDPFTPTTLYAVLGTYQGPGVFRSTNSGADWGPASARLPDGITIRTVAIDPQHPERLYAAGYNGVFKTTTSGTTWTPITTGLPTFFGATHFQAAVLAIDPLDPKTVFVAQDVAGFEPTLFEPTLFKTTTGGAAWVASDTGLGRAAITALAVDPVTPTTLYAGTPGPDLYRSGDGGLTWARRSAGLDGTQVNVLAIDPQTPSTLYAAVGEMFIGFSSVRAVFKSMNAFATWDLASTGLPGGTQILALVVNPVDPAILYAGRFRSADSAASWSPASAGLTGEVVSLAIDPRTPTTVYAATSGGLFKSVDEGQHWVPINAGLPPNIAGDLILVDPATPSTIYAVVHLVFFADPASPPTRGLVKSTSGGASWTSVLEEVVVALAIDPTVSSTLYAMTPRGVLRSTNGGASWGLLNAGLPVPPLNLSFSGSLVIDPHDPTVVYAGTSRDGVFARRQVSALRLSSPSGPYAATQRFDLTAVLDAPGRSVVAGSAVLDTTDVTESVARCFIPGTLLSGGRTFRCPNLTAGVLGPGNHTLAVTFTLDDGTQVSDTATWEIDAPAGAALTIAPPSGVLVTTQGFDLALLVDALPPPGAVPVAAFDGQDVTAALRGCAVTEPAAAGRLVVRCPGLTGGALGTGPHTFGVTRDVAGSEIGAALVTWEVLENVEP